MRKVILASRSKARKALLTQIGIKPIVAGSGVKERRTLKNGCAHLVIDNAMRKAQAIARKFPKGVVIGADTVVLVGKRIIGKPKDTKDAIKTLKLLSRKPQWVYTGVVVIDIENNTIFKAYEKTKVYLYPMTDKDIKGYIRKAHTLDKAGSFDIQGAGAGFVKHIEGSYSNVVGLPLGKLAKMLQTAGINYLY